MATRSPTPFHSYHGSFATASLPAGANVEVGDLAHDLTLNQMVYCSAIAPGVVWTALAAGAGAAGLDPNYDVGPIVDLSLGIPVSITDLGSAVLTAGLAINTTTRGGPAIQTAVVPGQYGLRVNDGVTMIYVKSDDGATLPRGNIVSDGALLINSATGTTITAANGAIVLDANETSPVGGGDITATAADDIQLQADNNVLVDTTATGIIQLTTANGLIRLFAQNAVNGDISLEADGTVDVFAGSSFTAGAVSIGLTSGGAGGTTITANGTGDIFITTPNTTGGSIDLDSDTTMSLVADSNVTVESTGGNIILQTPSATGDVIIDSGDNVAIDANSTGTGTLTVAAAGGSISTLLTHLTVSAQGQLNLMSATAVMVGSSTAEVPWMSVYLGTIVGDPSYCVNIIDSAAQTNSKIYATGDFLLQRRDHIHESFISGYSTKWSLTPGTATATTIQKRGGAVQLNTDAEAGQSARLHTDSNAQWLQRDGRVVAKFAVAIPETNPGTPEPDIFVAIGVWDMTDSFILSPHAYASDMAAFIYDPNGYYGAANANWQTITTNDTGTLPTPPGSTVNATGTQPVGTTTYTFLIVETLSNGISFYINDVLQFTHTTTMPTSSRPRSPVMWVESVTGDDKAIILCEAYASVDQAS